MQTDTEAVTATLLGQPLPVELMNTVWGEPGGGFGDALEDDAGAAAWLGAVARRISDEAGVAPDRIEPAQTSAAPLRELRDALRHLAAEATGDPRPPATAEKLTRPGAIARLNGMATTWPELAWLGSERPSRSYRAAPGATTTLGVQLIAHQGVDLFSGPDFDRLRPCLAPNCLRFFIAQHARREWCSPECGNRARVARHYRRHRTSGTDDRPPGRPRT